MILRLWVVLGLSLWVYSRLTAAQHFEKERSVWVEQGLVKGRIYKIGKNLMQMFLGIPYAEPPVGENRFKVRLLILFHKHQFESSYATMQLSTNDFISPLL